MAGKIFKTISFLFLSAAIFANSAWFFDSPEEKLRIQNQRIQEAVKNSQVLMFDEKNQQAIELLEKATNDYGENEVLCEALAYAYSQDAQYSSAAIYFEKAASFKNAKQSLLLNAARSYELCKSYDSALAAYEKYIKVFPKDGPVYKSIAKLLDQKGMYDSALASYMEFVKHSSRHPNTSEAADIGELFLKGKNTVQAKLWFNAALKVCDNSNKDVKTRILAGLIDIYLIEQDTQNLENAVKDLNAIDPGILSKNYPDLQNQINEYNEKLKAAKAAVIAAQKLEEERKKAEEARIQKAKEAELAAQKAAQEQKQKELALKKELEQKKAQQAQANKELPETKIETAEFTDIASPVLSQYEKDTDLCKELLAQNKTKEAEKLALKIVGKNGQNPQSWALLARAYCANGKFSDAYLCAKQAYEFEPENLNATLLYLKTGSFIESNEVFLNKLYLAHEKFPYCSEIMLGLARTYAIMQNAREAKYFYEKFLDNAQRLHPLYSAAQQELKNLLDGTFPMFKPSQIGSALTD